ncbi:DL-methionine transporter substrate-binding subunit [Shigella sonnei]|nr:DL-methionine transporter substrate-binding subunit [Shigella sonnei]
MAFKFKTFAAVGALIGSLALVGCEPSCSSSSDLIFLE